VFKRITTYALRYLMVHPDKPDEVSEFDEDEYDRVSGERERNSQMQR
jgi:hypothetical protein